MILKSFYDGFYMWCWLVCEDSVYYCYMGVVNNFFVVVNLIVIGYLM